jgi:hypothetical protein
MASASFGLGPLVLLMILVGLGSVPSLPLSLPPLPPDPVIERAAPDECLLHVALAGMGKPAADSANRAEALLADTEVQRFIGEAAGVAEKLMQGGADPRIVVTPEMRSLAFTLLTRPAALTVDTFAIARDGVNMEASLVVNCGPAVEQIHRTLEKAIADWRAIAKGPTVGEFVVAGHTWSRFEGLPAGTPAVAWGFKGQFFVAAIGDDALEHLLARLADKKRQPPAWKTTLDRRLPLERRSLLVHANIAQAIAIAKTVIREPEFAAAVTASGLDDLRAVQAVAGLTKTEIASATILDFQAAPTGFFAAGQKAVTLADLKVIPADAAMAQVVKLDLAATLATTRAALEAVQPRWATQATQMLEQVRTVAGVDVVKHLLEPLSDTWTVYTMPDGGVAAVVRLDDARTFATAHNALLGVVRQAAARPGMLRLELTERQVVDRASGAVTIFTAALPQAPLQPAWCIHGDRILVATSAERVEQMVARGRDATSLADVAAVQSLCGDRVAALGYQEPKAAVAALAAVYGGLAPLAAERLTAAGTAVPRLPDARVVAGHMLPAISVLRRDSEGDIIAESRSSLALGPLGGAGIASSPATAGIVVGVTLPAVQAAREAARRSRAIPADQGPMDTNAIKSLTPEQARKLATTFPGVDVVLERPRYRRVEKCLPLDGVQAIDAETARALVGYAKGPMLLNGLTTLSAEAAAELAKFNHALFLNGLTELSPETAAALAEFDHVLLLNGLTDLSHETAAALARSTGRLALDGLTRLSVDIARTLAASNASLTFRGLTEIDFDVVTVLAQAPRWHPDLPKIAVLDPACAKALASCKGQHLLLDGLTELDAATADGLAAFAGDNLSLNGLTALDADAARALAKFRGGNLYLGRLATLDPGTAAALVQTKGWDGNLSGLKKISPDTVRAVVCYKGTFPLLTSNLRSVDADTVAALLELKNWYGLTGVTELDERCAKMVADSGHDLQLQGCFSKIGAEIPLTLDWARIVSNTHRSSTLANVTALESRDSVAIAKALAKKQGAELLLPRLKRISPQALTALLQNERVHIPPVKTLEFIKEPDGSPTVEFVMPDWLKRREQGRQ